MNKNNNIDIKLQTYLDFVEVEMKNILKTLNVSYPTSGYDKGSIKIQNRGQKPVGEEAAIKLTEFFDKYKLNNYKCCSAYKQPVVAKEWKINIYPAFGDDITVKLGLNNEDKIKKGDK